MKRINKKASTPAELVMDFWATVIIVFIVDTNRDIVIETKAKELQTTQELLYIMQLPVEKESEKISFSEAIAQGYAENDYKLVEETYFSHILPLFYPDCIKLVIIPESKADIKLFNSCIIQEESTIPSGDFKPEAVIKKDDYNSYFSQTEIPGLNGGKIKVYFTKYSGKLHHDYNRLLCNNGIDNIKLECIELQKRNFCLKKFYGIFKSQSDCIKELNKLG